MMTDIKKLEPFIGHGDNLKDDKNRFAIQTTQQNFSTNMWKMSRPYDDNDDVID